MQGIEIHNFTVGAVSSEGHRGVEDIPGFDADDIEFYITKEEMPPIPKQPLITALALFICGSLLIIFGFI